MSPRTADAAVEDYGYFDDEAREFVLTTPRPPRHWKNILFNKHSSKLAPSNAAIVFQDFCFFSLNC